MASVTVRSLFKLKSLCWKELSGCKWKTERAAQDHAKHILFLLSNVDDMFHISSPTLRDHGEQTNDHLFSSIFQAPASPRFWSQGHSCAFKFVLKSSSLSLSLLFFSPWEWINESRVFVCADQYLVMKAVLQFPTKASLTGWICLFLHCYQSA